MFTRMMKEAMKRKIEQAREAAEARERQKTRLLPPDLASKIIEAADREREDLLTRLESIDNELTRLRGELREARKASEATLTPIWVTPPTTRRNWRGEIVHKEGQRGAGVVNAATIEANKRVREIADAIRAQSKLRAFLINDLYEIAKVQADAEVGVVPVMLHIVGKWHNAVDLSVMETAKLGSSFLQHAVPCDAAGNPLPPEALGPDG